MVVVFMDPMRIRITAQLHYPFPFEFITGCSCSVYGFCQEWIWVQRISSSHLPIQSGRGEGKSDSMEHAHVQGKIIYAPPFFYLRGQMGWCVYFETPAAGLSYAPLLYTPPLKSVRAPLSGSLNSDWRYYSCDWPYSAIATRGQLELRYPS